MSIFLAKMRASMCKISNKKKWLPVLIRPLFSVFLVPESEHVYQKCELPSETEWDSSSCRIHKEDHHFKQFALNILQMCAFTSFRSNWDLLVLCFWTGLPSYTAKLILLVTWHMAWQRSQDWRLAIIYSGWHYKTDQFSEMKTKSLGSGRLTCHSATSWAAAQPITQGH